MPGEVFYVETLARVARHTYHWFVIGPGYVGLGVALGLYIFFSVLDADPKIGIIDVPFTVITADSADFTRAIEDCRNASYKPELAATCVDYAQMLIELGGDADAEKIIAVTRELGMKPLMERVLAQRERLKV